MKILKKLILKKFNILQNITTRQTSCKSTGKKKYCTRRWIVNFNKNKNKNKNTMKASTGGNICDFTYNPHMNSGFDIASNDQILRNHD